MRWPVCCMRCSPAKPPFTGATVEAILVQRFTQPPPRITKKRPSVPHGIEAALYKAMARAPEERFSTVERFIASLDAPRAPAADLDRSIAVLPFANISGDPENEYFSDGISEEIINALTQLKGLRVAARTSAFSFKGKNVDLRSVGEQLNVATVLEGSVRRAGGRIRITAQLVNAADGYHLWSERYDRELTDIFAIQDEIASAIAEKLKLTLGVGAERQLVRAPTASVEAYDLYLKGHAFVKQRGLALLRAAESLEQAIALDPDFALAHAELAQALVLMSLYGIVFPADISDRARRATERALQLEPSLVATQIALALYFHHRRVQPGGREGRLRPGRRARSHGRGCPDLSGCIRFLLHPGRARPRRGTTPRRHRLGPVECRRARTGGDRAGLRRKARGSRDACPSRH